MNKFWKGKFFRQETVDASKVLKENIVRAKVEDEWQEFKLIELPDKFMRWNVERRLEMIKNLKEGKPPGLAGPHNAMVASYGDKRDDTRFRINNAVKGMGFLPRREKLDEIINLLKDTINKPMKEKLEILENLYKKADEIFDKTKQISLELYASPDFETHTFINEMINPAVSIVFLDIPSFEIKAIAHLLCPDDPKLSDYEKKVVEYANLVHDYFHGPFDKKFTAVIYYVIEVFDNSPGRKDAMGRRISP